MTNKKEWFSEWFNQKEYHLLYKHRDDHEASTVIERLLSTIQLKKAAKVMDLACGRGRHANYLHKKGFNTWGFDLSPSNIEFANLNSPADIKFRVHDMRQPFPETGFDAIFNFFTSFGYFESDIEHQIAIDNIYNALNRGGYLVLDYLNVIPIINKLIGEETVKRDGIEFRINRYLNDKRIIKAIGFEREGRPVNYVESIAAYTKVDFKKLLSHAGLQLIKTYGDYDLNPYDEHLSSRLILVAIK